MREYERLGIDWTKPEEVKEYRRKRWKKHYEKNKEYEKERKRKYYDENKDEMRKRARETYAEKDPEERVKRSREYYQQNKEQISKNARKRTLQIRTNVINRLGGKCMNCGIDDFRVLQIDHIYGEGKKDRKERFEGSPLKYYKFLLTKPLEEIKLTYQILCSNCNWIKRHENNEVK